MEKFNTVELHLCLADIYAEDQMTIDDAIRHYDEALKYDTTSFRLTKRINPLCEEAEKGKQLVEQSTNQRYDAEVDQSNEVRPASDLTD